MILLDTNVLSELLKPRPEQNVVSWVSAQPPASLFTSTIAQAEILYGVALLAEGRRRSGLSSAAQAMFSQEFAGRVLFFESDAAVAYALIAAERRKSGRPISQFDAQIAAIARSRGATLATRNTRDFRDCGVEAVDPWDAGASLS